MKVIEKIALVLFSYVALILAIIMCLFVFGWLDINFVGKLIEITLQDPTWSTGVLIVSAIFILVAIKCIFFSSFDAEKESEKGGIILENSDGKLLISKETLESLIASIAKGFNGAENVTSRVFVDSENEISVFVNLYVHQDAVIKDLSSNLQSKIKEAIKKTAELDVKEVNIKIKNIAQDRGSIEQ